MTSVWENLTSWHQEYSVNRQVKLVLGLKVGIGGYLARETFHD